LPAAKKTPAENTPVEKPVEKLLAVAHDAATESSNPV